MDNHSQAPAFDPSQQQAEGIDFWGFIRRRKTFFILFAAIGAGVGYFNYTRQEERFSSSALVQIVHHHTDPHLQALQASNSLQDAQYKVTSTELLSECAVPFKDLVTFKDCFKRNDKNELEFDKVAAARRAAGMITVKSRTNNVLSIVVEGAVPEDTEKIANAVAEVYTEQHTTSFANTLDEFEQLLKQAGGEACMVRRAPK